MKARLQLFLRVLAAFALALPAPARASIQLPSPRCAFDAGGQLASRTDFNNKTTTFSYDVMGRLLQKVPDASFGTSSTITFTYTVSGQRATMNDVSGSTTYQYDANRDWLVGKTKTIGSYSVTLNYTNDVAGNVVALKSSTANGTLVYYQWDALNRLAGVSGPMVGQTTYSYNGAGSLAGYTYPNSVATAYQYDSLNRLTSMVATHGGTNVASYAYTLGAAGNRIGVVELNARVVSYTYDPLYRLTAETVGNDPAGINGALGYTFDSVGNRLARSSNIAAVPTATHSYTANDWLTSDSYDSNGNTVNAGGIPDTYDFENRLVTHLYGQIVLVYDGDGNRVKQTASGMSTYYVVDDRNPTGYAQVLEELASVYSGATTLQRVYTHGHALISQDQLVNGQWVRSYYGQDGHGSVRYLTDGQGNVTDAYAYDAFGVLIRATGSTPNSYLYCGEQYDAQLGFYYLRARYANPKTGRFWNMDSYEGNSSDPQTLHKYLYCHGNSVNGRDPSGHDFSAISASVAGSIGASLDATYNGVVSITGNGVRNQIMYGGNAGIYSILTDAAFLVGGQLVMKALSGASVAISKIASGFAVKQELSLFRYAADYGILPCKMLYKVRRAGKMVGDTHIHHLIDQRFVGKALKNTSAGEIPGIVLTPAEHLEFTKEWFNEIGRDGTSAAIRTSTATVDDIWNAAKNVYKDYPSLLENCRVYLGK